MRRSRMRASIRWLALAIALLPVAAAPELLSPSDVVADCGRQAPSRDIRGYRGQAFIGRVRAIEEVAGPGTDWHITFDVDEVLAGYAPDPFVVRDDGGDCGTLIPARLRPGEHVLLSTRPRPSVGEPPELDGALLWRRVHGGWRFAENALWGGDLEPAYLARARTATTRREIVALVGGPALASVSVPAPAMPAGEADWVPVHGILGGVVPGLRVATAAPIAWDGRFWALETGTRLAWTEDARDDVAWHEPAVWRSSDGKRWRRRPLPDTMTGDLALVVWGDRLAIVERQPVGGPGRGLDLRIRVSTNGVDWRSAGRLQLRPTGDLGGCAFTDQLIATTRDRLVVTASCLPPRGSGGYLGPRIGVIAAVVRTTSRPARIPTYTWTSSDGRHWSRHRILVASDVLQAPRVVDLWSVGTGVAAIVAGTRQRLLWSSDGATFRAVADLPMVEPDVEVDQVLGVDLVPDPIGGGVTWITLLEHLQHDADHQPLLGTGISLWRLGSDGTWTPTLSFGGAAIAGALATDGDRVVVVTTERVRGADGAARRWTALSSDGGRTFTVSANAVDVGDECYPSLALLGDRGALTCDEPTGPVMRGTTLWVTSASTQ